MTPRLPVFARSQFFALPVAKSYSLIVSFTLTARILLSGLYARELKGPMPAWKVVFSLPVSTSHNLIIWRMYAEARDLPSGLYPRNCTEPVSFVRVADKVAISLPVATSHSLI